MAEEAPRTDDVASESDPRQFSVELFRRGVNAPLLTGVAACLAVVCVLLIAKEAWIVAGLFAFFTLLVASLGLAERPRAESGPLEITDEALVFQARPLVDRASIAAALPVEDDQGRVDVELRGPDRSIARLRAGGAEQARAIVAALGLETPRSLTSFGVTVPFSRDRFWLETGALLALAAAAVVGLVVGWMSAVQATALVASLFAAHLARQGRVEVGLDGVRVVTPTRDRSLPFAEIERAVANGASVELEARGGERYALRVRGEADARHAARALGARICEGTAQAGDPLPLGRAGQGADRVRALRAFGAEANADLRTAPLDRERLLEAAVGGGASAEDRAAAAVALSAGASGDERVRLQQASRAIVSEPLRVAVERAAAGADDEELAEALADVDLAAHASRPGAD